MRLSDFNWVITLRKNKPNPVVPRENCNTNLLLACTSTHIAEKSVHECVGTQGHSETNIKRINSGQKVRVNFIFTNRRKQSLANETLFHPDSFVKFLSH